MNLEALPKYYSPKSPKLSDDAPATGSGGLTITDVMAAQGMVQSKAPLGFALFLAKVGVQDPQFAIEGLLNYAMALDNPTLNKLSEETRLQIIPYLVNFAFADYSRSAASKARCEHCAGTGFHNVLREVVKHSRSGESVIKEEWVTEMNDTSGRWSYARQLYGHVYTAKIGTLSELVTAGDQFNQQHITLAGYEKETQTPADELAASRTARAAVFIRNDPARPTQTGELVGMLPAPKGKRFTMTEQQTLLSHGVATAYVESGVLRIQRDVTTYRKNAYGVADNSYLDSETLHTSAYVLRKLKSVITSKYGRHKLASDGTRFGPGQAIVTPAVIKGELLATYRQLERAGIVENYELFKQYLVVERDASDPNRLNTLFPPDYVNQLRVFAVVNQFRLQYSEESA